MGLWVGLGCLLLLGLLGIGVWWRRAKGVLEIRLDQPCVRVGDQLCGELLLQVNRPVRAGPLTVDLVAEVQMIEFLAGKRQAERIERYRESLSVADACCYPAGFQGRYPFQPVLPALKVQASVSEVAGLKNYQYERVCWLLEARLPLEQGALVCRAPVLLAER